MSEHSESGESVYNVLLVEQEETLLQSFVRRMEFLLERRGLQATILAASSQDQARLLLGDEPHPEMDLILMTASVRMHTGSADVHRSETNTGELIQALREQCPNAAMIGASVRGDHQDWLVRSGCHASMKKDQETPGKLVDLLVLHPPGRRRSP
tara:strand:- start:25308 stop:25769 length:462 start_codon:yes stop_codon:yes gene_type:complete